MEATQGRSIGGAAGGAKNEALFPERVPINCSPQRTWGSPFNATATRGKDCGQGQETLCME
jgi:hypothetical protein